MCIILTESAALLGHREFFYLSAKFLLGLIFLLKLSITYCALLKFNESGSFVHISLNSPDALKKKQSSRYLFYGQKCFIELMKKNTYWRAGQKGIYWLLTFWEASLNISIEGVIPSILIVIKHFLSV